MRAQSFAECLANAHYSVIVRYYVRTFISFDVQLHNPLSATLKFPKALKTPNLGVQPYLNW